MDLSENIENEVFELPEAGLGKTIILIEYLIPFVPSENATELLEFLEPLLIGASLVFGKESLMEQCVRLLGVILMKLKALNLNLVGLEGLAKIVLALVEKSLKLKNENLRVCYFRSVMKIIEVIEIIQFEQKNVFDQILAALITSFELVLSNIQKEGKVIIFLIKIRS